MFREMKLFEKREKKKLIAVRIGRVVVFLRRAFFASIRRSFYLSSPCQKRKKGADLKRRYTTININTVRLTVSSIPQEFNQILITVFATIFLDSPQTNKKKLRVLILNVDNIL